MREKPKRRAWASRDEIEAMRAAARDTDTKIMRRLLVLAALLLLAAPAQAKHHHHHDDAGSAPGLANATLLLIRHAEKPASDDDPGLAPAGEARAKAYAGYFQHFTVDGAPVKIDTLVATDRSKKSDRPELTLTPLSEALHLPIQHDFADKDVKDLARWLAASPHGNVLIAWHHGKLPKLLEKLGADPSTLLPDGAWPPDVYDWVIVLRYDADGTLSSAKRIVEPADLK